MRDTSKRREKILTMLREQGSVQVNALSQSFRVSTQTIRQDLGFLSRIGMAARAYGGAVLRERPTSAPEAALETKRQRFAGEKSAIGKMAAALVVAGETIVLDSGTTTLQIAAHLPADVELTVLTNDLAIANEVSAREQVNLLMLGGTLRRKNMSLYGTQAEHAMHEMSVDKLFLGVDGFDLAKGVTTHFEPEAVLNRLMCDAAAEIIVVMDSSKFGKVCLHRIVEPSRIDKLITDERISRDVLASLAELGVEVIRVPL
jgi:DeoR family transcriptional regulator of aga operon